MVKCPAFKRVVADSIYDKHFYKTLRDHTIVTIRCVRQGGDGGGKLIIN